MTLTDSQHIKRALLLSAYSNSQFKDESEEHLNELALLTMTYGAEVVGKVACLLRKYDPATFFTKGKVEEFVALSDELNADIIIIDEEIPPSQQKNLEILFKKPVVDRAGIILEVFASRAQTKEAKLQVELAKLRYEAPRLKRMWTHLSRQQGSAGGGAGGGGGYLKGEGEKQIEIDRRILKKKVELLKDELEGVRRNRELQRSARQKSEIPTFAIIGYTNAGKSTLMNSLTNAGVFVEDKLFATLDTTTRKFSLPNGQEILLIDTVGFIRKLPHLLIAAFKSTLEESLFSDVLLHLIDISHPAALEHAKTTHEVLKELGAGDRPMINILNKVDQLTDRSLVTRFKLHYPHTVEISALKSEGFDVLLEKMVEELKKKRSIITFRIPQSDYQVASEIIQQGHVLTKEYEENDILITVEIAPSVSSKWKHYISNA